MQRPSRGAPNAPAPQAMYDFAGEALLTPRNGLEDTHAVRAQAFAALDRRCHAGAIAAPDPILRLPGMAVDGLMHCIVIHKGQELAHQLAQTRIDTDIKAEASALLAAMGLTVSDAVRLMLTRVAREYALPFDPLIPNATTIAAMMEARAGNLPNARTIDALKSALSADDCVDRAVQTR
jgi:DNA-damage-inducible protein J